MLHNTARILLLSVASMISLALQFIPSVICGDVHTGGHLTSAWCYGWPFTALLATESHHLSMPAGRALLEFNTMGVIMNLVVCGLLSLMIWIHFFRTQIKIGFTFQLANLLGAIAAVACCISVYTMRSELYDYLLEELPFGSLGFEWVLSPVATGGSAAMYLALFCILMTAFTVLLRGLQATHAETSDSGH